MKTADCSNCGRTLTLPKNRRGQSRAHVICPECGEVYQRQSRGMNVAKVLSKTDLPSLVLDKQNRVLGCNESYIEKIAAGNISPAGLLMGEFLECVNSYSPEGCGQTHHCGDCAIRQAASKTLKTGKAVKYIPAYITRFEDNRKVRKELLISATPVGKNVQVTVETLFKTLEPLPPKK